MCLFRSPLREDQANAASEQQHEQDRGWALHNRFARYHGKRGWSIDSPTCAYLDLRHWISWRLEIW